jgi:hypothetical protein
MATYYTYYSYEEFGRGYIGYRKCPEGISPEDDSYLGSFTDKTFKPASKVILTLHNTKEEAISAEMKIQRFFKVVENPHFANKSYQKSTGFSFSDSGENHPMCGKNHTKESKERMSKAKLGRKLSEDHIEKITGEKHHRYSPIDWHHPIHGDVLQVSLSDLARMYPNQKLDTSALSKVIKGKLFQTGGWRLLENKGIDKQYGILRNWCHSSYGFFQNVSAADLVKKYPEDKLSITGFCHLVNGRSGYYKGWVYIDEGDIDNSLSEDQLNKIFSTEYSKNKISEAKEKARENTKNRDYPVYVIKDWYHPDHGVVRNISIPDLVRKYSGECKLSLGLLYAVVWGNRSHHKRWTLYKLSAEGEKGQTH